MTLTRTMKYDEAASFLEERFSEYLALRPAGPLAARHAYDPANPGARFPLLSVVEIGSTGTRSSSNGRLPEVMVLSVKVYDVSLSRSGSIWKDGTAEAKRRTRAVHALWREVFLADRELHSLVRRAEIISTEQGDADALGNPRLDEKGANVLWVHQTNVRIVF